MQNQNKTSKFIDALFKKINTGFQNYYTKLDNCDKPMKWFDCWVNYLALFQIISIPFAFFSHIFKNVFHFSKNAPFMIDFSLSNIFIIISCIFDWTLIFLTRRYLFKFMKRGYKYIIILFISYPIEFTISSIIIKRDIVNWTISMAMLLTFVILNIVYFHKRRHLFQRDDHAPFLIRPH